MGGFDTDSSHLWKFGTNSSHVSNSMPVLHRYDTYVPNLHTLKYGNVKFEHKFYPPSPKKKKWSKLTVRKFHICQKWRIAALLVPNLHGVQFTKCEIRSSNLVSWKRIISRLPCDFFKKDKKKRYSTRTDKIETRSIDGPCSITRLCSYFFFNFT